MLPLFFIATELRFWPNSSTEVTKWIVKYGCNKKYINGGYND
jgi:hypothetical protein